MKCKHFKLQSAIDKDYVYNVIYDQVYYEDGVDCSLLDRFPIKKNTTNIFDTIWENWELFKTPIYKILRYIDFDGPI